MIAKVLLKYKGEECMAEVFRDGTAILESGEKIALSSDQMDEIQKKVSERTELNEPILMEDKQNTDKVEIVPNTPPAAKESELPLTDKKKKRKKDKKLKTEKKEKEKVFPDKKRKLWSEYIKNVFAALGVFSLILALVGGAYCLVRSLNKESILPEITMSQGEMNAQELKEAESIVIVGRVYTKSGEVQEVVLGYINADELSSQHQGSENG